MDRRRLETTFEEINKFGNTATGMNRLAYTREERDAVKFIEDLCIKEGFKTRTDACGNLIVRREGQDPELPVVACGSHVDTVYDGGKYDGVVGVLAGLEAIRSFNDNNIKTLHPVELIVFACEESSRFGVSTVGSRLSVGLLDIDSLSAMKDKNGISIHQAFTDCGLDVSLIDRCIRSKDEIKAFLEVHIEQGTHLEQKNLEIGVVTGIAAPTRLRIKIEGVAAHSGSTSMLNRKDALLGAAEIALLLEEAAKSESYQDTVGTVGVINIKPGAMNVIPGYAEIQVDIRGIHKESKEIVFNRLIEGAAEVGEKRGLKITWEITSHEDPVLTDKGIQDVIVSNCKTMGLSYTTMPSGGGHDAMNMARYYPTGMIFVPSKDGLSHNRDEYTPMKDIVNGAELLEKTLLDLAVQSTS
ncbi:MAG: Zn-dependent hydrolase [Alkalispirochaeta sp.]